MLLVGRGVDQNGPIWLQLFLQIELDVHVVLLRGLRDDLCPTLLEFSRESESGIRLVDQAGFLGGHLRVGAAADFLNTTFTFIMHVLRVVVGTLHFIFSIRL